MLLLHDCKRANSHAHMQAERAAPKPTAATLHRAAQGAASRPASAASGSGARASAARRTSALTARRPAKRRARESSVSSLDDEEDDEDEDLELSSDTVCRLRMALPAACLQPAARPKAASQQIVSTCCQHTDSTWPCSGCKGGVMSGQRPSLLALQDTEQRHRRKSTRRVLPAPRLQADESLDEEPAAEEAGEGEGAAQSPPQTTVSSPRCSPALFLAVQAHPPAISMAFVPICRCASSASMRPCGVRSCRHEAA